MRHEIGRIIDTPARLAWRIRNLQSRRDAAARAFRREKRGTLARRLAYHAWAGFARDCAAAHAALAFVRCAGVSEGR